MIIVITSPDNISIGMFYEYLRKYHLKDSVFVHLNGLMPSEIASSVVEDAIKRHPTGNIIFKHKTRSSLKPNKIPQNLQDKADSIIGFALYSTHAEPLKSAPGWTDSVIQGWSDYVAKMNATKS